MIAQESGCDGSIRGLYRRSNEPHTDSNAREGNGVGPFPKGGASEPSVPRSTDDARSTRVRPSRRPRPGRRLRAAEREGHGRRSPSRRDRTEPDCPKKPDAISSSLVATPEVETLKRAPPPRPARTSEAATRYVQHRGAARTPMKDDLKVFRSCRYNCFWSRPLQSRCSHEQRVIGRRLSQCC